MCLRACVSYHQLHTLIWDSARTPPVPQQKLSNAERFAKMRESRDRARLRLEAAQEQIARLEAELKVAQLQQLKDSRSEAQVIAQVVT